MKYSFLTSMLKKVRIQQIILLLAIGINMQHVYGNWVSPITSDLIVQGSIRLGEVHVENNHLYWLELHPKEKGRYSLYCLDPKGEKKEILPKEYSARTRVHEYGGGAYQVANGKVYFSNDKDQNLYVLENGNTKKAIQITSTENSRFADMEIAGDTIYSVEEVHGNKEPQNRIVKIENGKITPIHEKHDFYASPTIYNGHIAFIGWDHPNMPWDGTYLYLDGKVIAGAKDESVLDPKFAANGDLYFISDRSGFWNIYRYSNGKTESVCEEDYEFGAPLWVFGCNRYIFTEDGIICIYTDKGIDHLGHIDLQTKKLTEIKTPFTSLSYLQGSDDFIAFEAASPTQVKAIYRMDLKTKKLEMVQTSSNIELDPGYISLPETIEFPTTGGKTAYGFYYPPKNKDYSLSKEELPPLIVKSHGGPTAHSDTSLALTIQYWTSRGFAFMNVNYGGSTGYGREYRRRLNGNWGVVDVDDCTNAALYLAKQGKVDKNRLIITGGSAGGYTTLACLAFKDVFHAGTSLFGVADILLLQETTHKFESRYDQTLVGKLPENAKLFDERSPLKNAGKLSCPVLFLQGDEDKIVTPDQSIKMFDALKANQIPTGLIMFKGEQHGFRKSESIKRALDAELYFYSKIFKFPIQDNVEPVEIHNL